MRKVDDCVHMHSDGCGSYCKAINTGQLLRAGRIDSDYPHTYWRTDCYGILQLCRFRDLFEGKKEPEAHLKEG